MKTLRIILVLMRFQLAFRDMKQLRFKAVNTDRLPDWCRICLAEYLEQLKMLDPLIEELISAGAQLVVTDPPTDETTPSCGEVRDGVSRLMGGKAAGIYEINGRC